jgi:hypothetical protein
LFVSPIQAVFETRLKDMAMAVPLMCCAADMVTVPHRKQVVLVGHKPSIEFENMLAAAHASYDPFDYTSFFSPVRSLFLKQKH